MLAQKVLAGFFFFGEARRTVTNVRDQMVVVFPHFFPACDM